MLEVSPRRQRIAVVLFQLGGPDRPEAVAPFLLNLFSDPAILRVPGFVRPLLAWIIARARRRAAGENYALLGGKSPLLELTERQARALEHALSDQGEVRCFVAMRYWHPFSSEAARAVRDWGADEVVLVPLYPQFSTTTTGSSITAWREAAADAALVVPTVTLCCWHSDPAFAASQAEIVRKAYHDACAAGAAPRVLFSAHGLPASIIAAGDPYQWQVEQTVARVVERMGIAGLDHVVCYQSRVTPQKWIGPSTEDEIERAGHDKVPLLIVPIAFVSEHSETLVELDIEYREEAEKLGVPGYFRAPAPNDAAPFIDALAAVVRRARQGGRALCSFAGARQCPKVHRDCPHARAAARIREAV